MNIHDALVVVRLGVVAAGGLSGFWCLRRGSLASSDRWTYFLLAAGFGLIAFGAVVEGILFEFAGWGLVEAHAAEALVGIAAFSAILVSILRSRV